MVLLPLAPLAPLTAQKAKNLSRAVPNPRLNSALDVAFSVQILTFMFSRKDFLPN